MSRTGRKNHTHKYHKLVDGLWHCALSDCTHYMPRNVEHAVLGKESICWECAEPFKLDEEAMKFDEPLCVKCRMESSGIDLEGMSAYINKQLADAKKQKVS